MTPASEAAASEDGPIKTVIQGAGGRMGRMLIRHILEAPDMQLAGAIERASSEILGQDAGQLVGADPCGIIVQEDPHEAMAIAHALIDFSTPASTVAMSALAAQARVVHVIGTTGLTDEDGTHLKRAARHTPVVWADNMSLGVTLLSALVEQTAARLREEFDIEIVEMHHRHKVDAPSGTALALGHAAAKGRGVALEDVSARGRDGITGARGKGQIGFAALRGGEVIGDHTVMFASGGERLELTHKASGRDIYAHGALTAVRWGVGKPPGLYSMRDVLDL